MTTSNKTGARLSLILSPPAGVTDAALADRVVTLGARLRDTYGEGVQVRAGIREADDPMEHALGEARGKPDYVPAVLELTAPAASLGMLVRPAAAVGKILSDLVDTSRCALTVGMVHHVVPPRTGPTFVALACCRDPGKRADDFLAWWTDHHARLAVPLMGASVLAYDHVHVDKALSERASSEAGVNYFPYDAYESLSFASVEDFLAAASASGQAQRLVDDETGWVDHSTFRCSLMREI